MALIFILSQLSDLNLTWQLNRYFWKRFVWIFIVDVYRYQMIFQFSIFNLNFSYSIYSDKTLSRLNEFLNYHIASIVMSWLSDSIK